MGRLDFKGVYLFDPMKAEVRKIYGSNNYP